MAAAVLLLLPASASAQRVTVNSLEDSDDAVCSQDTTGDCTLREAMLHTPEQTIVELPAGEYELTGGALPVGNARFLQGAGARRTTIRAGTTDRVMTVTLGGAHVTGVTISGGDAAQGGGIFVGPGLELNLTDSTVTGNHASTGGGIYSEGLVRLERSTLSGNTVSTRGGGLAVANGDAKLFDTTISSNSSSETGAGLWTAANVELHNVTIAGNDAVAASESGGGIEQSFDSVNDVTVAFNTLVADNFGGNCLGAAGNDLILARFSMADDGTCQAEPGSPGNVEVPTGQAGIDGLTDNGGPTDTHALQPGSPAIGAAEDGTCEGTFDPRGLQRPQGATDCDIGAYERAEALTPTTTADDDSLCTPNDCSLREALELTADDGTVTVPAGNYVLELGALEIARKLDVVGAGARTTTLTGSGADRVLVVSAGEDSLVSGVRITGGDVSEASNPADRIGGGLRVDPDASVRLLETAVEGNVAGLGGGIFNGGGITVERSTVASNQATGGLFFAAGGGLFSDDFSRTVVTNSTISGNTAAVGGGIASAGAELSLLNATLAGNSLDSSQGTGSALYHETVVIDGSFEIGETLIRNSLLAGNPGTACAGNAEVLQESANNITDHGSCPAQLVPSAGLAGRADNGGPTDTHALLAGSPAIDAGSDCAATDQRGVSRPQGAGCDAGAVELVGSSQPPQGGGGGGGGGTTQPPPDDEEEQLPPPQAGEEVNALPKSGTVRVKVAGTNRFVELEEGRQIPVGSVVDTTKGRVTIVAAGGQSADFYDGIFRLSQGKGAKPLTTLTLVEALSCPKAGSAVAAAKGKKKRRLWGDGSGKFRTKGKHSAATVVGTRWLVEDRCTSTLTRVVRGKVSVRDFVKKKTVIVRAGKKYVARAKKK